MKAKKRTGLLFSSLFALVFLSACPSASRAGIDLSGGGTAYLLKYQAEQLQHRLDIEANAEESAREFVEIAERVREESAKAAAVLSAEDLRELTEEVKEQRYREAKRLLAVVMSKLNSGSTIQISSTIEERR